MLDHSRSSYQVMYVSRYLVLDSRLTTYQLIPQDIKFDPSSNPACFSSEDQVIEKGSKVRLKIVGTRVDATEIVSTKIYKS